MKDNFCLLDIFRRNRDMPIFAIAVERCENLRISEGFNRLIHMWQWISVPCGHGIQLPVINTEPQGTVIFGHQDNRNCPQNSPVLLHLLSAFAALLRISLPSHEVPPDMVESALTRPQGQGSIW
jgi:hypothetical protein